jgi:hypothetical protein
MPTCLSSTAIRYEDLHLFAAQPFQAVGLT